VKTIIFDLDGVLYLGDQVIPGVTEALTTFEQAGFQLLFATNASVATPQVIAGKLARLTETNVLPESVLTSALATAYLLKGEADRVYVMGGEGIRAALRDVGVTIWQEPTEVDAVVVGIDYDLTYSALSDAVTAAIQSQRLIGTNSDVAFPTPQGLRPGGGTLAGAVSAASGVEPLFAGKPHQPMLELLLNSIRHEEVWMVGDRADTDLALAARANWKSALTLTGVTKAAGEVPNELRPDLVVGSVADLASHLL
jgi:HAD superfamily hydrolase (TIGR01450 family)